MARVHGLLQCIAAAFGGATQSAKVCLGTYASELSTTQRYIVARQLLTSSLAADGVASAKTQPAASTGTLSDARKDAGREASSSNNSRDESASNAGFSTGFRRVLSERRGALGALEGVIHIQNTLNNIILTLTDKDGSVKAVTSAGVVGFRGSRKSQPVAAEKAAEELARRALKLGYSSAAVRLKGAGSNKQYAVQSLAAAGLQITSLADVTPIPYNGCRPPKKRRV